MIREAIDKILGLAPPNFKDFGGLSYSDKALHLVAPPVVGAVECSTLSGLADLCREDLDGVKSSAKLVHVVSPETVELIAKDADEFGKRRVWARAQHPEGCATFPFGRWLAPDEFVIAAQAGFQRVLIQNDDGSMAKDLDYVLQVASSITSEAVSTSSDDGIKQTVGMKRGVHLQGTETLRPRVLLAPFRTFTEIDQPISLFILRARQQGDGQPALALFEGDGGRWRIAAAQSIQDWFRRELDGVPVIR